MTGVLELDRPEEPLRCKTGGGWTAELGCKSEEVLKAMLELLPVDEDR